MENAAITETVKTFILQSVNVRQLDNDNEIFKSGLATSLFSIQLMTFIEKKFSIKVTMDDLDMENFKSVNAICDFINRKQLQQI